MKRRHDEPEKIRQCDGCYRTFPDSQIEQYFDLLLCPMCLAEEIGDQVENNMEVDREDHFP